MNFRGPALVPEAFALGLLAYIRQAALSLDRTPPDFTEAMRDYYAEIASPDPAVVLASLERLARPSDAPARSGIVAMLLRRGHVRFMPELVDDIEQSVQGLQQVLRGELAGSHERRVDIRMRLTRCEMRVERRLGRKSRRRVRYVEHLNQHMVPGWRLAEIAGPGWLEGARNPMSALPACVHWTEALDQSEKRDPPSAQ